MNKIQNDYELKEYEEFERLANLSENEEGAIENQQIEEIERIIWNYQMMKIKELEKEKQLN